MRNLLQGIGLGLTWLGQVFPSNSYLGDFPCSPVKPFTYFLLGEQVSDCDVLFGYLVSLVRNSSVVQMIFYIGNRRKDFQGFSVLHKIVRFL